MLSWWLWGNGKGGSWVSPGSSFEHVFLTILHNKKSAAQRTNAPNLSDPAETLMLLMMSQSQMSMSQSLAVELMMSQSQSQSQSQMSLLCRTTIVVPLVSLRFVSTTVCIVLQSAVSVHHLIHHRTNADGCTSLSSP